MHTTLRVPPAVLALVLAAVGMAPGLAAAQPTTTTIDGVSSTSTTSLDDGSSTSTTSLDDGSSTSTTTLDGVSSTSTTSLDDGSSTTTSLDGGSTSTSASTSSSTSQASTTSLGGSSTTSTTVPGGQVSALDVLFVTEAAMSDLGEITSGQLAGELGQHPDVRTFGLDMVTEHCANLDQLESAADQAGIPLPRALDITPCVKDSPGGAFPAEPSRDFDLTYMRGQILAHRKALDLYRKEARSGTDPSLQSFASAAIPVFQDHLRRAKQVTRRVSRARGGGGGGGANGAGRGGGGPAY